jgi:hypothetical protein
MTAGREERLALEIFEDVELAVKIDRIETKGHARIFIGHVDGPAGQAAGRVTSRRTTDPFFCSIQA